MNFVILQNIYYEINDKPNGIGRYCIHEACIKGNIVMLKGLLAYVDDINKVDQHKQTAAHIASIKFDLVINV